MPICNQCGGEIEFRVIDGQVRPIHLGGSWNCSGGGGGISGWSSNPSRPRLHSSYRIGITYVNPNAHCPVCGAAVFFYQSPDDGRVFFDELGPPWPKHACTDQGLDHPMIRRALDEFVVGAVRKRERRSQEQTLAPRWVAAGFTPFSLTRGDLLGKGIRMHGTVFGKEGRTSRPLQIRITARHHFRIHATDPRLAPWREIGVERWVILGAVDNGLVMVREETGSSAVLLSIVTAVPLGQPHHGGSSAWTEILEVQGEVEVE